MKVVVTGGAGFIGSNLVNFYIDQGHEVVVIDDLSSGFERRINPEAHFVQGDLLEAKGLWRESLQNSDLLVHLAANVDNRHSWNDPHLPIRANVEATLNVGLAARDYDIPQIIYSSTGTAYGDLPEPPYLESQAGSSQTSLYGATKFAGEGILSVFAEHYGISVKVLRFVGVLGPGYSHGHVYDFVRKLKSDPQRLDVLGNGYQQKSYVYVSDLCRAIDIVSSDVSGTKFNVFNLGRQDFCTVRDSVRWICEELQLEPELIFESSPIGWVGDNPNLYLDTSKLTKLGWEPKISTENSVRSTASWLMANDWIYEVSKEII